MAKTYRIKDSTLAMVGRDGKRIPIPIPAGSIVTVEDCVGEAGEFTDVLWNGRRVALFTQDLETLAERMPCPAA